MPQCRFCWRATIHGDSAIKCEITGEIIGYELATKQTKCKHWIICKCIENEYIDVFAEIPYRGRPYKPRNKSVEKLKLFEVKDLPKG